MSAIEEGRRIGDSVRKFVAFLLSANLGEIVLFAIAVLGGLGVPMTVVQVLTVNLVTDGRPPSRSRATRRRAERCAASREELASTSASRRLRAASMGS